MTILADAAKLPPQHAMQRHAALLGHLLTHPLPEMYEWIIGGPGHPMSCDVRGQLSFRPLDVTRVQLHQCAAVLDSPTWHVIRHKIGSLGELAVRGTFHGMSVEFWALLDEGHLDVDVCVLAELDEPVPTADAPTAVAEGPVLRVVPPQDEQPVHFVTIEPVRPDDPQFYVAEWDVPPRLSIVEHRPGWPAVSRCTEGWIPLESMLAHARAEAARLGVPFVEPTDELAVELLGGVSA